METKGAYILRETTGTSGLERTLEDAVWLLSYHLIPHLVAGGLAVQEHGYFRVTLDVDLIVADPREASEYITNDVSGPFEQLPGIPDRVRDKRNGVFIDFLPAGRVYRRTSKIPFPEPGKLIDAPTFVSLEQLISLKLDSWSDRPSRRHKDKTDVIELIQARKLPRDFAVLEPVRDLYLETWDALARELGDDSQ